MIRKLKNIFIAILSLFVIEVIIVGFILPEMDNAEINKSHSSLNRQYASQEKNKKINLRKKHNRNNLIRALQTVLNKWNDAINNHRVHNLKDIYAVYISYYGKTKSKSFAIKDKQRALDKNPEFRQYIKNAKIYKFGDHTYRVAFDKYIKVGYSSNTKMYPAYLDIKKFGKYWKIINESDKVTDENLRSMKRQAVSRKIVKRGKNGKIYGTVYRLDPTRDGFLAFRNKPRGRMIGRFHNGDRVEILSKKGNWYKVKDMRSKRVGWAYGKWIRI